MADREPTTEDETPRDRSFWSALCRVQRPLERETVFFIGASALDVFMTYLLLHRGGFQEANPIALWFIYGWGVKGMVFFKFAMVAFVTVLAQIIALKNVNAARRVLQFGTVVVACVVIYSLVLLLRTTGVL